MAGIGQADNQPVNVPVGPLVTPATPVGQDAVNSMIDAFRKGTITSSEIVDRFGLAAREKTQAAANAAQLVSAQAQAELPLVPLQAEAQKVKLGTEIATGIQGPVGLQAFQQMGPWEGRTMAEFQKPDGTYDFTAAAAEGNKMAAKMNIANAWIERMTPVADRVVQVQGKKYIQKINKWGVDVTPPSGRFPGSDEYWNYASQLNKVLPQYHPARGQFALVKGGGGRGEEELPGHEEGRPDQFGVGVNLPQTAGGTVNPKDSVAVDRARADLIRAYSTGGGKEGQNLVSAVATMTPEEVVSNLAKVVPAPPSETAPLVTPAAPAVAALPEVTPPGILTEVNPGNVWDETKIRENLLKEKPVQAWQETSQYATAFEANANQIRNLSDAQQRSTNLNVADIGLAESIIKMYDPQGTIREFKWDKFETNQPRIDLLKNAWQVAMRNGTFTPNTRRSLIQMGDEIIRGREEAARPFLEKALRQAQSNPDVNIQNVFTEEEAKILARAPGVGAAPAPVTSVPQGRLVDIPGLGRGYLNGNSFTPVRQ